MEETKKIRRSNKIEEIKKYNTFEQGDSYSEENSDSSPSSSFSNNSEGSYEVSMASKATEEEMTGINTPAVKRKISLFSFIEKKDNKRSKDENNKNKINTLYRKNNLGKDFEAKKKFKIALDSDIDEIMNGIKELGGDDGKDNFNINYNMDEDDEEDEKNNNLFLDNLIIHSHSRNKGGGGINNINMNYNKSEDPDSKINATHKIKKALNKEKVGQDLVELKEIWGYVNLVIKEGLLDFSMLKSLITFLSLKNKKAVYEKFLKYLKKTFQEALDLFKKKSTYSSFNLLINVIKFFMIVTLNLKKYPWFIK